MSQEEYKLIVEYYTKIKERLNQQLIDAYRNKAGIDVSDIIRGKIMMLQDFINLELALDSAKKLKESNNTENKEEDSK